MRGIDCMVARRALHDTMRDALDRFTVLRCKTSKPSPDGLFWLVFLGFLFCLFLGLLVLCGFFFLPCSANFTPSFLECFKIFLILLFCSSSLLLMMSSNAGSRGTNLTGGRLRSQYHLTTETWPGDITVPLLRPRTSGGYLRVACALRTAAVCQGLAL